MELAAEYHFAVGNDPVGIAPSGPTFFLLPDGESGA